LLGDQRLGQRAHTSRRQLLHLIGCRGSARRRKRIVARVAADTTPPAGVAANASPMPVDINSATVRMTPWRASSGRAGMLDAAPAETA